jgi:hypothetical protein
MIMNRYFKSGFTMALHQPFAVVLMFLYQLGWGIIFYKLIQSVLLPLMHRYPGVDQPRSAVQLFFVEGQFQLLKTDLIKPYLWWLVGLIAIRMLVTPLLNAGIYYSLAHHEFNAGYRFVKGIRELALPFFLIYLFQMAFTLTPIIWLLPKAQSIWFTHGSYSSVLYAMLPWLIGFLLYGYAVRLCFIYIQFSQVSRVPLVSSFSILLRYGWLIVVTAVILLILSALLAGTAITAAYIWAGFVALLIYQLYPFCKMFLQIWAIAAQFQLWTSQIKPQ